MKHASIIALLLLFVMLAGCASGPSDDEASKIVSDLVRASYEMNIIYFGDGMPSVADVNDDTPVSFYSDLTDDAPYLTEAELREATLGVFTENYASVIFETFLSGVSDPDSGGVVFARYVEQGDRLTKKVEYEPLAPKMRTYDLENITIKRSRADYITATLKSYVDGVKDVDVTVTIRLEERDGENVWRLDSPTY